MSLLNFLRSKVFLKQLLLALLALIIFAFIMLKYLKWRTNHGQFVKVPELAGKSLDVAGIELKDNDLVLVVQDSANYNPDFPRFSVIEQIPEAGSLVKEERKIYITLNPSGFRKVAVPEIIRKTYRQAKPTLETIGFEIGKITYVNDIGKDEVISMSHEGERLSPGTLLPKTSKIDLVLGNGSRAQ